jgi:magnesium transporter
MNGHLITVDGTEHEVTAPAVKQLIDSSARFWLNLSDLDSAGVGLLRDTFGFHPLAVEDAEHFGQRPKIDTYDDFSLLVVFGATGQGQLTEVHCFYSANYLVTIHQDPCPDLADLCQRLRRGAGGTRPDHDHVMILYRVLDTLVDSYFPVLDHFDDHIDELEDEILQQPTEQQMGRLFDMKRSLIALRKVVTPERDMFATLLAGGSELAGMTPDAERYFRDLYDHMIRISDLVDSYRDLLSGALDTHLSTVSNRLNVVMKQLTIIATVFLPMSFLTGFFGQNFGWLVDKLSSLPVFLAAGIGSQVVTVIALMIFFRRRGWLSAEASVPAATPSRTRLPRDRRWRVVHPMPAAEGPAT